VPFGGGDTEMSAPRSESCSCTTSNWRWFCSWSTPYADPSSADRTSRQLFVYFRRDKFGLLTRLPVNLTLARAFTSFHVVSVIERFRWARDLDRRELLLPYPPKVRNPTPWAFGSSAASFAHSSAFHSQAPPCEQGTSGAQSPPPVLTDAGWRCVSWPRGRIFGRGRGRARPRSSVR
jgi:hypothetical protein